MGNQFFFQFGFARASNEAEELFSVLPVPSIEVKHVRNRRGNVFGRQFDGHVPDLRRAIDLSAQMEFIHRCHVRADAFADAVQSNGGRMMLGTGIVAPADVNRRAFQILRNFAGREDVG